LEVQGVDKPIALAGGDFIFLPQGGPYTLRDALDSRVTPVEQIAKHDEAGAVCQFGGGGAPSSAIWGCFEFEDGGRNPLLESLPPMIHLTAEVGPNVQWLQSTLQFVASETSSGLPGAETVANRLTDILFVHAIRAHISGCAAHGCRANGWLRALADPKIGQALRLIHEAPHKPWTVETLAKAVAMSRSAFAALFAKLVGESPLRYVTAWRMKKATHMLLRDEPIAVIGQTIGYESDAAFGKAFKKHTGKSPGEFRRIMRERGASAKHVNHHVPEADCAEQCDPQMDDLETSATPRLDVVQQ
jgi:AraC-like DNA-binding protein